MMAMAINDFRIEYFPMVKPAIANDKPGNHTHDKFIIPVSLMLLKLQKYMTNIWAME